MNPKPTPENQAHSPEDGSFEQRQLQVLETLLEDITHQMQESDDYQNSKTQALFRFHASELRVYLSLKGAIRKQKSGVKKDSPPEFPPTWVQDPVCFAREALHIELYDHQIQLCRSRKRVNLLIAGRGAGKSLTACVIALHNALREPRHTVLVVSSGQRMSSDFGVKLIDLLRESVVRPWIASVSSEQIQFLNGSVIKLLPANHDTIRGYHPKNARNQAGMTVILDEACFMEQGDEIRKAVEYALITTSPDAGRLYIVSSPSTTGSWVYEYVQKSRQPQADMVVIQCASSANPAITPEEIERLRHTKNEVEFRAEVLGEWVDGAYGLFCGLIESNIVPGDDPLPSDRVTYAMGADLALAYDAVHDRNALAVVARWWETEDSGETEPCYRLMALEILTHASDREIRSTVNRLVERYNIQSAAVEQYQGKSLAEYTQSLGVETQLIAPTAGRQQEIFHELHRLLRQNQLQLSDGLPDLFFEEMKSFEYKRQADGHITFGHPNGAHDDTVYALAWALHASQTGLAHEPDTDVPPLIGFIEKR